MSCIGKYSHNYYFIHGTWSIERVIKILNDGYIEIGQDLDSKYLSMSDATDPFNKIFGHIYFEDLKNLPTFMTMSFIIHPKIICDRTISMNKGWQGKEYVKINKNDSVKTKISKLNKMRELVQMPLTPWEEKHSSIFMQHEIILGKRISVKKYIIGIVIGKTNKKIKETINKIIKKKNYKFNIVDWQYMPKLNDLIK